MESLICLDSSVLIEYFRNKNKSNTFFAKLILNYTGFVVPVTVHFEIFNGSTPAQQNFWDNLFSDFLVLPMTVSVSVIAIQILKQLKTSRITLDFKDLTIAACAIHHNFSLATLNEKHFENIHGLHLITPSSFTA